MWLTDSPYNVCQAATWDKIILLGYMQSLKNTFVWDKAVVKLTGITAYDCQHSWVYKESRDGLIATNFLSMWMMGDLFSLQKNCTWRRLEGGDQPAHGWVYRTPQGRFNPRRKQQDHWN